MKPNVNWGDLFFTYNIFELNNSIPLLFVPLVELLGFTAKKQPNINIV